VEVSGFHLVHKSRSKFYIRIKIQIRNQDPDPGRQKKLEKANNVLKSGMFSWSSAIVVDVQEEKNIAIFQSIKKRTFTEVLVTKNL
jgi:hypothetical protein